MNKHLGPTGSRKQRDADFVLLIVIGLIAAVVIWGLIRDQIDTTALLALSTLAGGIVGLARRPGGDKKPGDGEDDS